MEDDINWVAVTKWVSMFAPIMLWVMPRQMPARCASDFHRLRAVGETTADALIEALKNATRQNRKREAATSPWRKPHTPEFQLFCPRIGIQRRNPCVAVRLAISGETTGDFALLLALPRTSEYRTSLALCCEGFSSIRRQTTKRLRDEFPRVFIDGGSKGPPFVADGMCFFLKRCGPFRTASTFLTARMPLEAFHRICGHSCVSLGRPSRV